MPEFYIKITRKNFFPNFWGARAAPSLPPVSYANAQLDSTQMNSQSSEQASKQATDSDSAEFEYWVLLSPGEGCI